MKNLKKIFLILFVFALAYSFLPVVTFLFVKGASVGDNNASNTAVLQNNGGAYFSFIVLGDNHAGLVFNDAATLKQIWHINREDRFRKVPIDFVMNTGDVTLNGKRSHFEALKKIRALIKYPFITAIGNHDERALFEEFCGESDFAFRDRNAYFIVLDNEAGEFTEEKFIWFENELKKGSGYGHIFVIAHKPAFNPYQQEWYNMDEKPWSHRFRALCGKYGVDMVFSGHKHMFKSEKFDGVEHIVTGGGGMLIEFPEADGGYLHYVRVVVSGDYVTYEVRKVSPPLWEYVTYYSWKEVVYWVRNFYGAGINVNSKVKSQNVK